MKKKKYVCVNVVSSFNIQNFNETVVAEIDKIQKRGYEVEIIPMSGSISVMILGYEMVGGNENEEQTN